LFSWLLTLKMHGQRDSPKESAMAVTALKRKPEPELKTYHATMLVTRAEDWCVEAESPEEARELLAAGLGHRYHLGERVQYEVETLEG
jgi:hypothetical protein